MINLLPTEAKQKLDLERIRRLFLIFGLIFSAILLIGIFLLLPTWVTLDLQEEELVRQYSILNESPELSKIEGIELNIGALNEKTKMFKKNLSFEQTPSLVFNTVLDHIDQTIRLQELSFNSSKNQFSIKGTADRRENYLAFINILENDPLILKVESPISNILKDRDIEFTLIFEADPDLMKLHF
ncbi:MAG: hypothetical protein COU46_02160 [Candidatus Niyogibacteria bacterium CG10_big_fil_rev_8_21_14_0_10_42_19]|uniref:Uncharacterized protein n=1 Tax=Candidatus Niyogibacteria bacterium CG10_big_fil_rev_8_21_14_0_10_42_19 TaxID=1974725 RepID=A0A2H0TH71_9BACT|nr:MAG: hypothetical protein COU46_02160 [Candidatus Niyogibacteria bacterium CG10_big_fil_rev_8_21_14_0_10_42_19]